MVERLRKNTEPGQGASPRENAEALFNRLDQDGDGVIMVSDLPDGPRESFAEILQRADRNRDERITVEEFLSVRNLATMALVRKFLRSTGGRRIVQLLRRADRNGDGQLTRRESPPISWQSGLTSSTRIAMDAWISRNCLRYLSYRTLLPKQLPLPHRRSQEFL